MKTPELPRLTLSNQTAQKASRRGFLVFSLASVGGFLGWIMVYRMEKDRGLPWLLRRANEVHDTFWHANFRTGAMSPPVDAEGKPIRFNGGIGLLDTVDLSSYRLKVIDPRRSRPLELTLDDVKNLPSTHESFQFKCIEGWTQPVSCKGVRFSEFMRAFGVGDGLAYAGMASIDRGYYVSWDMKSLMHPQTILCYEMNGAPLKPENGAPLRILSSVKYGVKQIKQLGLIMFSRSPQSDYWAERRYNEYLGL